MSVTNATQQRSGEIVPVTLAERFYAFIDSNETSLLYKVEAVALPLILSIATGVLMQLSLLGCIPK